jgi:hypothetical protein
MAGSRKYVKLLGEDLILRVGSTLAIFILHCILKMTSVIDLFTIFKSGYPVI